MAIAGLFALALCIASGSHLRLLLIACHLSSSDSYILIVNHSERKGGEGCDSIADWRQGELCPWKRSLFPSMS